MNVKATKSEFAADVVESLTVALRQFPLGALFQPPDGNNDEAHGCIFRQGMPSDLRRG
jgi:hypothetical protein